MCSYHIVFSFNPLFVAYFLRVESAVIRVSIPSFVRHCVLRASQGPLIFDTIQKTSAKILGKPELGDMSNRKHLVI